MNNTMTNEVMMTTLASSQWNRSFATLFLVIFLDCVNNAMYCSFMPKFVCDEYWIGLECPKLCGKCKAKTLLITTDITPMITTTAPVTTDTTTESSTNRKLIRSFSLSNNKFRCRHLVVSNQ